MTRIGEPEFLLPAALAARWGISIKTLANWRSLKIGPAFTKLGRTIRYPRDEVRRVEREGSAPLNGFHGAPGRGARRS